MTADQLSIGADPAALRRAFGTFATGVTILTIGEPQPHGMTATSFTSVSLDPPLVLVCVDRRAVMHRKLDADAFGVSVLASDQEAVARHFANRARPLGSAQFECTDCTFGRVTGVPLIGGAIATFECRQWRRYDGGDHTIVLGRLVSFAWSDRRSPLVFFTGAFRSLPR